MFWKALKNLDFRKIQAGSLKGLFEVFQNFLGHLLDNEKYRTTFFCLKAQKIKKSIKRKSLKNS